MFTSGKIETVDSLHVPAMKFIEVVCLKSSNYTLNITIFVNTWILVQFRENLKVPIIL